MNSNTEREIYSSRVIKHSIEKVYEAFVNPQHLKNWWGPEGFTNTIHEFDLKPEGKWILTMHGPDKGNYKNESIFKIIQPHQLISWTRVSQPFFDMEIHFKKLSDLATEITFLMTFKTLEEREKIRKFVEPKNEENFDRLENELSKM
ncbi:SRPBCC domain-containing protein [Flavobacterium polysaccharolyticum]|uniref:SRPBCC domain-containing protein n=1 Tax=Flavobacterium polysaccharolyticum TaxID=3133148 RepID=A0ABU9NR39_9FLAO